MRLIERKPPTHTLVVELPLSLGDVTDSPRDELTEALNLVLTLARLGTLGILCGDIEVTLKDTP